MKSCFKKKWIKFFHLIKTKKIYIFFDIFDATEGAPKQSATLFFSWDNLKSGPSGPSSEVVMKDAHCAKPNEKSIFRILFFKLRLIVLFRIFGDTPNFHQKKSFKSGQIYRKDAECAEMNEKSIFRFFVFEIWSFLYPKLVNFQWILSTKLTIKKWKIDFSLDSA